MFRLATPRTLSLLVFSSLGLADAVDGFTSEFGASLFGAAASFLKAGAWGALPSDAPLRVLYRIVLDNAPGAAAAGTLSARVTSYVVRTGSGPGGEAGVGVAVYGPPHEAVAALAAAAAAAGDDDEAADAPTRGQALNFVGTRGCSSMSACTRELRIHSFVFLFNRAARDAVRRPGLAGG